LAGADAPEARRCRSQTGFAALAPAEQGCPVAPREAGDVRHPGQLTPAQFFQTVVEHVIEGYYSDPGNGGNREAVSWRMIGYVPGTP
jgi:gluconate 2-dehydrogenase gamma chain